MNRKGIIKILVGCVLTILLMTSFSGVVEAAGPPHDSTYDEYGNQHKVWEKKVGTGNDKQYEIFYQGKIDGNWGPEIRLSFTESDSIYPRIAYDLTLKILYIMWLEEEGSNTTLYYCGSGDLGQTWTEMREYGIPDYWAQRYHIEIEDADNGTITVKTRWANHEEYYHEIKADLDGDFIIDREDVNPFTYNFLGDIEYDYDVLTIDEELGVSVATKFKNFIGEVTIENVTFPEQEQMNSSHGIYIKIESTEEIEEAIIKMKSEEDYLMYTLEKHMYWRIVYAHGEQTGSFNNVTWAKVTHFSTYTSGDPDSWDSDGDGLWDNEEYIEGSLILEAEDCAGEYGEIRDDSKASDGEYVKITSTTYDEYKEVIKIENIGLNGGEYDLLIRAQTYIDINLKVYLNFVDEVEIQISGNSYEWYHVSIFNLSSTDTISVESYLHQYGKGSYAIRIDMLAFIPLGEIMYTDSIMVDSDLDGIDDGDETIDGSYILEAEDYAPYPEYPAAGYYEVIADPKASGGRAATPLLILDKMNDFADLKIEGWYDIYFRARSESLDPSHSIEVNINFPDYNFGDMDNGFLPSLDYKWYSIYDVEITADTKIEIANGSAIIDKLMFIPSDYLGPITDPLMADTDGDGLLDGEEVVQGEIVLEAEFFGQPMPPLPSAYLMDS